MPYIGVGGFDVLTTMYRSRSGTKSELAGVSVSLRGLALCAHSVRQSLGLTCDDRHFSYIWPAFTAERLMLHAVLAAGGAIGFFGGVRSPRIFEDIKHLRPSFLVGTASLFRRQITRLHMKHVGMWGTLSYHLQRWALLRKAEEDEEDGLLKRLAEWLLRQPLSRWLNRPFVGRPRPHTMRSQEVLRAQRVCLGLISTADSTLLGLMNCLRLDLDLDFHPARCYQGRSCWAPRHVSASSWPSAGQEPRRYPRLPGVCGAFRSMFQLLWSKNTDTAHTTL